MNLGGYYALTHGALSIAAHVNVLTGTLDPLQFGTQVGFRTQIRGGRFLLTFDPMLQLDLYPGDPLSSFVATARLSYSFSKEWAAFMQGGLRLPLFKTGSFDGSFGLGAVYSPSNKVDLSLQVGFDQRHDFVGSLGAAFRF